jgi:hypothetical protein
MAKRKHISLDQAGSGALSDTAPAAETADDSTATETTTAAVANEAAQSVPLAGSGEPSSTEADHQTEGDHTDTAAPPPTAAAPSRRFLHLAAAVALAAALGAILGSLGSAGIARLVRQTSVSAAALNKGFADESRALRQLAAKLAADVTALKAMVAASTSSTNSQFAKIAERFDHAKVAPAAKLAKITEALDRLERRVATETTGSIGTRQAASAKPKQQDRPPVVTGWVLHDVYNGRALVEGRGGLYEVRPGDDVPGLGRIKEVRRQDGRWVVVTSRGLIVSAR